RPHALPQWPYAGTLGVQPGNVRTHRNLRAMTCFARERGDLDRPVGDFRHLEGEQLSHQAGMGPRQRDLWTTNTLVHLDDVAPDPRAVFVTLARHLLAGRQHGLDLAEIDEDVPLVVLLLDDAADDVAFATCVHTE